MNGEVIRINGVAEATLGELIQQDSPDVLDMLCGRALNHADSSYLTNIDLDFIGPAADSRNILINVSADCPVTKMLK